MSDLELELAHQILLAKLPVPIPEFKALENRRMRWDFAWVEEKLLVEVQGGTWIKGGHSTGDGLHRDYTKLNLAILAGYRVFMFDSFMIKSGEALKFLQEYFRIYAKPNTTPPPGP